MLIYITKNVENLNETSKKISLSGHYNYRRILRTMYPMVLMMLVTSIYSIVDGFFIAHYVNTDAFAGTNIIWPLLGAVGAIGIMTGTGGSALVSKTLGEGNKEKAQRIFSIIIQFTFVVGIIFVAIFFIFMPQIAIWLGADEKLLPPAVLYGRIWVVGLPFYMLTMAFNPFFMVTERPGLGTKVTIVCGVTNIFLDALFIIPFGWDIAGAAIASVIAMIIGGAFPIYYFIRKRTNTNIRLQPTGKWNSKDIQDIKQSCTNGVSELVGSIAHNLVCICYNIQLMRYIGSDGVVAYGLLMYLSFLFASVFLGYNMGIAQVISYNYGAKNHLELTSLLKKSYTLIGICGVLLYGLSIISIPFIATAFVGDDKNLHELCVNASRIYMLCFLINGYNYFASAWFTALNNGKISAIVAMVRTLVLELGCVFLLPLILGIKGVWMSVVVAELLAFFLSKAFIQGFRKKYGY